MNPQLMSNEKECPYCDGVGTVEGNKGIEVICNTCKGKGTIYATEKPEATKDKQADEV